MCSGDQAPRFPSFPKAASVDPGLKGACHSQDIHVYPVVTLASPFNNADAYFCCLNLVCKEDAHSVTQLLDSEDPCRTLAKWRPHSVSQGRRCCHFAPFLTPCDILPHWVWGTGTEAGRIWGKPGTWGCGWRLHSTSPILEPYNTEHVGSAFESCHLVAICVFYYIA